MKLIIQRYDIGQIETDIPNDALKPVLERFGFTFYRSERNYYYDRHRGCARFKRSPRIYMGQGEQVISACDPVNFERNKNTILSEEIATKFWEKNTSAKAFQQELDRLESNRKARRCADKKHAQERKKRESERIRTLKTNIANGVTVSSPDRDWET